MKTFAVMNENVVENCITAETIEIAEAITGKTCIEYSSETIVSLGFTYADGIFIDPNAPAEEE